MPTLHHHSADSCPLTTANCPAEAHRLGHCDHVQHSPKHSFPAVILRCTAASPATGRPQADG